MDPLFHDFKAGDGCFHEQSQNNVIMEFSVLFYCEKHSWPALLPTSPDCNESNTSRPSSWDPKYLSQEINPLTFKGFKCADCAW